MLSEDTELGIRIGQRWPEMSWLYQPARNRAPHGHHGAGDAGLPDSPQLRGGCRQGPACPAMGAQEGLSSERRYVSRRPAARRAAGPARPAARRSLRPAALRGDRDRAADERTRLPGGEPRSRAAAATMSKGRGGNRELASPDFAPVLIADVEIGASAPHARRQRGPEQRPYAAALCLVRLHGRAAWLCPRRAARGRARPRAAGRADLDGAERQDRAITSARTASTTLPGSAQRASRRRAGQRASPRSTSSCGRRPASRW